MTAPAPHNQPSGPSPVNKSTDRLGVDFILFAALIGAVALGFYIYHVVKNKQTANNSQTASSTAEQIRQLFSPPAGFTPSFQPPQPGQLTNPNQTVDPRFGAASQPAPAQDGGSEPAAQSQSTGGQTSSTGAGQAVAGAQTTAPVAPPVASAPAGYAETYPHGNLTLDDLRTILSNSPSVKSVALVTVNGQPALQYVAYNPQNSGIAMVIGENVYYLHGAWATPAGARNFHTQ
ncbi:MAG: hypothetical protein KGJ93_01745 [Patescibacteria group bacterium]|nr:hypothetical protein [Patescibacteria group bacterium]